MSAIQELCCFYGVDPKIFSREENYLLEANLFTRICEELKEIFREQNKEFFRLIKFTTEMEDEMLETNFIRFVINDILATDEYTLDGIAYYSGSSGEVIQEVAVGLNTSPSLALARKIIELHRSIRPKLYNEILTKVTRYTEPPPA